MLRGIEVGDFIEAYTPVREDEPLRPPTTGIIEAIHESAIKPAGLWVKLFGNPRLIPDDRILVVQKQSAAKAA